MRGIIRSWGAVARSQEVRINEIRSSDRMRTNGFHRLLRKQRRYYSLWLSLSRVSERANDSTDVTGSLACTVCRNSVSVVCQAHGCQKRLNYYRFVPVNGALAARHSCIRRIPDAWEPNPQLDARGHISSVPPDRDRHNGILHRNHAVRASKSCCLTNAPQQSLAADGAIACFSSSLVPSA